MDQARARHLAKEGFELFEESKLAESLEKYREAALYIDKNHIFSDLYYGEYAMVLRELGMKDEAIEALYNALRSSIATDDVSSISVTLSRHFLVNCLVEYNKIDEAEKALDDWHNKECDGRWMLNYSAAKMYFKSKNIEKYIECVEKTYLDAPKEKWASIDDIRLEIEDDEIRN